MSNTNLMYNPILDSDSYKYSHYLQLPPGAQKMYAYLEARSDEVFDEFTVIGLQYLIKRYLMQPVTKEDVDQAEAFITAHGEPFNREGWDIIVNEYDGYLPIEIHAVDEGTVMDIRNVFMDVENTDERLPWLTTFVETKLLRNAWYASTVSAVARRIRQTAIEFLKETSDLDADGIMGATSLYLNDFGSRGSTSYEASALGGLGHLVYSMGTDNVPAVCLVNDYYHEGLAGLSIPASEHSTVTSWPGKREGERQALRNHIKNFSSQEGNPTGLYAFVSDSYDLYALIEEVMGQELHHTIISRDNTLVVRPDSGDPREVVPEVMARLDKYFGSSVNSKGYKVLNPKVRVIQGDGITVDSVPEILGAVAYAGFSTENMVLGMGGGLLQKYDRDTLGFAMKGSNITISGENYPFSKNPATDPNKRSKEGRLSLIRDDDGNLKTVRREELSDLDQDLLKPRFYNGQLLREQTFGEIREKAQADLYELAKG